MQLFYAPDISGETYCLSAEESKHCIRVLRMSKGDAIQLVDGNGSLFTGEIADPNPKQCKILINNIVKEFEKRPKQIHIAIAPTKNINRFEWFLEKAVEIGVDRITPIICDRSERRHINTDRLEGIIISAMKQSVKAYKPELAPAVKFNDFVGKCKANIKLIAYCGDVSKQDVSEINGENEMLILIGPEGDFTEHEVNIAISNGFIPVSLGKSRLRTETAGVVSCVLLNSKLS